MNPLSQAALRSEIAPTPASPADDPQIAKSYLHPGQSFISKSPTLVSTILGSCIAVCLWDPYVGCGGVTHFLLPSWDGTGSASSRYGTVAVAELIRNMMSHGCKVENLCARIFGGACMFQSLSNGGDHLGFKNAAVARQLLDTAGVKIGSEEIGGERGRKLTFCTSTGSCAVKLL